MAGSRATLALREISPFHALSFSPRPCSVCPGLTVAETGDNFTTRRDDVQRTLDEQLAELLRLETPELRERYEELLGEPTTSHHRLWP